MTPSELRECVLAAIRLSCCEPRLLGHATPFEIELDDGIVLRRVQVHISDFMSLARSRHPSQTWSIKRSKVRPRPNPLVTDLLLGWHDGYGVFAGFDTKNLHRSQLADATPFQVPRKDLVTAHNGEFTLCKQVGGGFAIVFQPALLWLYAVRSRELHAFARHPSDLHLLEQLAIHGNSLSDSVFDQASTPARASLLRDIPKLLTATSFRARVLSAYGHQCAACDTYLGHSDVVRLVPVADFGSPDETSNGTALCGIHRRALDAGAIYIADDFRIRVCEANFWKLEAESPIDALSRFRASLKSAISLPPELRQRPSIFTLRRARELRGIA